MARLSSGIRQRKDGTFESRFTIDGRRYSVYGKSQKECKEKEIEIRNKIISGMCASNDNITVEKLIDEYLEYRKDDIKPSSLGIMRGKFANYVVPYFKGIKVKKVESRMIEKWFRDLPNTMNQTTKNGVLSMLKGLFEYAIIHDVIIKNPVKNIKPVKTIRVKDKATNTIHRALTKEEVDNFMNEAKEINSYYYELFALLLSTGMRIGEASALSWNDIDYKKDVIHVHKTVAYTDRKGNLETDRLFIQNVTKSSAGMRDIPMNDTIREILSSQKSRTVDLWGNVIGMNDLIFRNMKNGGLIESTTCVYAIKSVLKNLKKKGITIDKFTCHAFRDTFATRYFENGGNPKVLQEILGHGSFAMTMDLYTQVMDDKKVNEMNTFANVINF